MDSQPTRGPNDATSFLRRAPRFSGRALIAALVVLALVIAGVVVGVTDPFKSPTNTSGSKDNGYPTGLTTVKQRSLTEQTQVTGTLGYSGSYTVSLPTGTESSAVSQAQEAVATDESKLESDEAALVVARRLQNKSGTETIRAAVGNGQIRRTGAASGQDPALRRRDPRVPRFVVTHRHDPAQREFVDWRLGRFRWRLHSH